MSERPGSGTAALPSRAHLAVFAVMATPHPALIPQEVAGSSQWVPAIPAARGLKDLL